MICKFLQSYDAYKIFGQSEVNVQAILIAAIPNSQSDSSEIQLPQRQTILINGCKVLFISLTNKYIFL